MEHVRKIMEIMDDEMFPTKREWVYVKICNELKQIHIQLQELSRLKQLHAPGRLDPSAHVEARSSARIDPSAPPRVIRDAWRDLNSLRVRPRR